VIFDERWLADVLPLERFLEPPPDVWTDQDEARMLPRAKEEQVLLGVYIPMHSPGRVLLLGRNLRAFFWSLVAQLHHRMPYLTASDLKGALRLVVAKTYQQELFHFHSDVLRQIFGASFDPLLEEALAVAWSRLQILQQRGVWNSQIGRMNGVVFNHLLPAGLRLPISRLPRLAPVCRCGALQAGASRLPRISQPHPASGERRGPGNAGVRDAGRDFGGVCGGGGLKW